MRVFTGPFRTLAGSNPPAVPARKSRRRAEIPPHRVNISSRPPGRLHLATATLLPVVRSGVVAVVFILVVACSHSAPSPPESPARPASWRLPNHRSRRPPQTTRALVLSRQVFSVRRWTAFQRRDSRRRSASPTTRPRRLQRHTEGPQLRVQDGLPPELPANLVNRDSTGVFTDAGYPHPGHGLRSGRARRPRNHGRLQRGDTAISPEDGRFPKPVGPHWPSPTDRLGAWPGPGSSWWSL